LSQPVRLLLASASPRRRELVALLGLPWEASASGVDESAVVAHSPAELVVEVARRKAVVVRSPAGSIVVAADTEVVLDDEVLGKPGDVAQARRALQMLRGRSHWVYTGIAVASADEGWLVRDLATIEVPMREYSDLELEAYLETGDPMDKAGSYAIQHPEFRPVEALEGCYAGVVGLPLCHLSRALQTVGIEVRADLAAACQAHHNFRCPVFEAILTGSRPLVEGAHFGQNTEAELQAGRRGERPGAGAEPDSQDGRQALLKVKEGTKV
jgi:MAF protein